MSENGEEEEMAECIGVPAREFMPTLFSSKSLSSVYILIHLREIRDKRCKMGTRRQRLYSI